MDKYYDKYNKYKRKYHLIKQLLEYKNMTDIDNRDLFPFKDNIDFSKLIVTDEGKYSITKKDDGIQLLKFMKSILITLDDKIITDLTGNIFEKFSGIFNDIFQDEEGKFNLGIDYVLADRRPGSETDGRFGVTVSSKINDRITFNGKLGVPIGGINQSAVVGDVEVQYRVNEDGTLNLRVFNKENDITFIGQNIGYTQGLGISYEIDFNTFKELVNKIFKKKILAPKITNSINQSDSDIPSDGINFKSKKNKPKKNTKANSEAILNNEID